MADHCSFCNTRRPVGGTNILVLGDQWLEFCQYCGEREFLTNSETGEKLPVARVFEMTKAENEGDQDAKSV